MGAQIPVFRHPWQHQGGAEGGCGGGIQYPFRECVSVPAFVPKRLGSGRSGQLPARGWQEITTGRAEHWLGSVIPPPTARECQPWGFGGPSPAPGAAGVWAFGRAGDGAWQNLPGVCWQEGIEGG